MRRETLDAIKLDARREMIDASHVSRLTPRRFSGLTSRAPWPKVKLGEVCSRVTSGGTPSTKHPEYYGGTIPWLRTQEVDFKPIYSTELFITEEGLNKSSAKWIPENTVIVAMYGATAGRSAITKIALTTNQACCNLLVDELQADYRFVYYTLRLRYEELEGLAKGSAQTNLSAGIIKEFEIPLPPLPVQRRIADILSAYDDLIENNRRRIAILEETARLTYRKWFGGAEQSWVAKLGKVSDFFDVSIGRTPPRKNEECFSTESTDLKWLSIKDMRASRVFVLDTTEKLTKAGIEKTHIHVSPPGTIFLSFKLTVGEVVIAGDSMATNEAIAHFETNDRALRDYTYFYLSSFQYDKLGSTSAIARAINSDIVRKMDFMFPARNVLERFGKDVAPMFDQIENLTRQNAALAAARDMLLPRLMKGEVA